MQQALLASVFGTQSLEPGGAPVRMPDLQFARRGDAIALSPENLAPGVDVDALPQPVRLTGDADEAGEAGGFLAFKRPVVEDGRLTLGLEVRAVSPQGGRPVAISTLSLHYSRRGAEWVPGAPPAALSS